MLGARFDVQSGLDRRSISSITNELDQRFLVDEQVIEDLVNAALAGPADTVLDLDEAGRLAPSVTVCYADYRGFGPPLVSKIAANPPFMILETLFRQLPGPGVSAASLVAGRRTAVSLTASAGLLYRAMPGAAAAEPRVSSLARCCAILAGDRGLAGARAGPEAEYPEVTGNAHP